MANHRPLCLSPWRRHNTTIPRLQNPFLHFSSYSLHLPSSLFLLALFFFQSNVPFFLFGSSEQVFFSLFPYTQIKHLYVLLYMKSTWFMFSVEQQLSLSCGFFNFPWLSAWRFKHNRNLCTVSNKILTAWYQRGTLSNFLLAVPHSDVKYNTAVLLPAV